MRTFFDTGGGSYARPQDGPHSSCFSARPVFGAADRFHCLRLRDRRSLPTLLARLRNPLRAVPGSPFILIITGPAFIHTLHSPHSPIHNRPFRSSLYGPSEPTNSTCTCTKSPPNSSRFAFYSYHHRSRLHSHPPFTPAIHPFTTDPFFLHCMDRRSVPTLLGLTL